MRVRPRSTDRATSLLTLGTELAMLGVEAQIVIGQRMALSVLGGPMAHKEAQLMVAEKVAAVGEATVTLATGGSLHAVVRGYRRKVRANHRRLGKS